MLENGELVAVKANKFVQEYKVSLTMTEIRIINYLIANIHSPKYDKKFNEFRFSIKEFCDVVYGDSKQGAAYKRLPDIIQKLSDKSAWKDIPNPDKPGKTMKVLIRWIEKPILDDEFIRLRLDSDLAPYLLELEGSFIKSKFIYTTQAQSKYTIPLYELLKSWEKAAGHKKRFEIDELRLYMDATEKTYINAAAFKRRILDVAVKEINEITDLLISYEEVKRGRKTTHIEFTILHKDNFKDADGTQESFSDPESMDEYMKSFQENTEYSEEEFARNHYQDLMEQYPMFNGRQIAALFQASLKHVDVIGLPRDKKQDAVAAYMRPKWRKIEATPDETKTTPFNRLLDMVEKNY